MQRDRAEDLSLLGEENSRNPIFERKMHEVHGKLEDSSENLQISSTCSYASV
jgi:hypothetical protein